MNDGLSAAENILAELQGINSNMPTANVDQLTAEILILKSQTAFNIIEIGQRLIQVKKQLPHGQWGTWLAEKAEFSHRAANNFMAAAKACGNSQALANLGATKVFALLELPPDQREEFIAVPHQLPTGETKTVDEMTTRELQRLLDEKDKAEKRAAKAESEAAAAEKAKLEAYEAMRERGETIGQLQKKLDERPEKEVVKPPSDYAELKKKASEADILARSNQELDRKAKEALAALQTMQTELDTYRRNRVDERASVQVRVGVFSNIIKEFIDKVAPLGYLASEYLNTSPESRRQYESALGAVEKWCQDMRENLILPERQSVIEAEVIE